jgi:hypothetical protein
VGLSNKPIKAWIEGPAIFATNTTIVIFPAALKGYLMDRSLQWQPPSASQIPEVWPRMTQPAVHPPFPNVHLEQQK